MSRFGSSRQAASASGRNLPSFRALLWGGLALAWVVEALFLEAPDPIEHPLASHTKTGVSVSGAHLEPDKAGAANAVVNKSAGASPSRVVTCATNQTLIPAGVFSMGSSDGDEDEEPVHRVTLSEYCIDKTEVTVAAYRACVQAGHCRAGHATAQWGGQERSKQGSRFCNWGKDGLDQHPMNCVDWNQAAAYCAWTGGRLPTEAEWEFAARGEDGRKYPWGDQGPDSTRVNACGGECVAMAQTQLGELWVETYKGDDGWTATAPVGSFPKGGSPLGVLDMAGNVWEWTDDSYGRYTSAPATDPHPTSTDASPRVCRGGGWGNFLSPRVLATQRQWQLPVTRVGDLGFRCVR
jgi:formylglycine-generating enzyme required for sulfatase activity